MDTQQLAQAQQLVEQLLQLMGVEAHVSIELDASEVLHVQIDGENLGILIGHHGETLASLQTILSLMVHRELYGDGSGERHKVLVNVGDYRERQQESLQALARRSAERVRFTRKSLTLPPMSSYDRRIVHMALQQEPDVMGESEGEGRDRRLVVKLKEDY